MHFSVLCIGGNDPTGGAGLTMDARIAQCFNRSIFPVLSCLTAQDGSDVKRIDWLSKKQFESQLDSVVSLCNGLPRVIKIGLFAHRELIDSFVDYYHCYYKNHKDRAKSVIIYDPIFANGNGSSFLREGENSAELIEHIKDRLLPICSIMTPNHHELAMLNKARNSVETKDVGHSASLLLQQMETQSPSLPTLILSGGHGEDVDHIISHRMFRQGDEIIDEKMIQIRFQGNYRGTGCALASAIACETIRALDDKKEDELLALEQQQHIIQRAFDLVHSAVAYTHQQYQSNSALTIIDRQKQILYFPQNQY